VGPPPRTTLDVPTMRPHMSARTHKVTIYFFLSRYRPRDPPTRHTVLGHEVPPTSLLDTYVPDEGGRWRNIPSIAQGRVLFQVDRLGLLATGTAYGFRTARVPPQLGLLRRLHRGPVFYGAFACTSSTSPTGGWPSSASARCTARRIPSRLWTSRTYLSRDAARAARVLGKLLRVQDGRQRLHAVD
jgi:hypothetical protein